MKKISAFLHRILEKKKGRRDKIKSFNKYCSNFFFDEKEINSFLFNKECRAKNYIEDKNT